MPDPLPTDHTFAALPADYDEVFLVDAAGKKIRQLLWGDWLWIDPAQPDTDPDWRHIVWAPSIPEKTQHLKVRRDHTTDDRPLEVVFVDVGQGDGCVLITPERDARERVIVIDAGKGPHMGDFLESRFGSYRKGFRFHAAVITHPDEDHYGGFGPIFAANKGRPANQKIKFDVLYHSGLVERAVPGTFEKVGGVSKDPTVGESFCENLVLSDAEMRAAFAGPPGNFSYPAMIKDAIDHGGVGEFRMLSTLHGMFEDSRTWVPDFAPSSARDYSIEVLGPWTEPGGAKGQRLRRLGDYGKTKNGHSVILKLHYNDVRVIFGGDLNAPAERFLLQNYGGASSWPTEPLARETMLATARPRFRAEVLKVCHHGSSDVTDEFLEAVNPAAFVISSGDEEGHVHPRPDLLGRLGKFGRGDAPVLLSTELQRSTRDREDAKLVADLKSNIAKQLVDATPARQAEIDAAIDKLGGSNVDVDGAIYLKTDGKRLICAFKKEVGSATKKWFYFEYAVIDGKLVLRPR